MFLFIIFEWRKYREFMSPGERGVGAENIV